MLVKGTVRRVIVGRLQRGEDLLGSLTRICREQGVRLGRVEAIGAVEGARLGFYHQDSQQYEFHTLERPLEILALVGNVSLRDGEPMVHAHVTLSDAEGKAIGGHLAEGTRVFACEFAIEVLEGGELHRGHDEATGLPLWTRTG